MTVDKNVITITKSKNLDSLAVASMHSVVESTNMFNTEVVKDDPASSNMEKVVTQNIKLDSLAVDPASDIEEVASSDFGAFYQIKFSEIIKTEVMTNNNHLMLVHGFFESHQKLQSILLDKDFSFGKYLNDVGKFNNYLLLGLMIIYCCFCRYNSS
jgi:hypothetical protein